MTDHYDKDSQAAVNAQVLTKLDQILACQRDMEDRIRKLEAWRYYMIGVCAVVMWGVNRFLGK